ncbi:MAG TPA: succinate dehydrogenase cytochrome b subunit [Myxococcota bacterium]|jgi:succinate dehydrogenase / fumarate reductase cytochrome b subunit|nr:succinate dehydrogenase cytochrome b subunit [Myxococcota bacterium]
MHWLVEYYRSTVGKKFVMAITGVLLFLYVLAHMAGNLQIYLGAERINAYAAFLHSDTALPLLWGARIVLGAALVLHILAAVQLTVQNWSSRPQKYAKVRYREADIAARTMIWSGPIIGLFLVYHILHLTTGSVEPAGAGTFAIQAGGHAPDAYANLVAGFRVWWVSAFYIAAVVLLGIHFYHGLWSWFQTLGWSHPRHNGARRALSTVLSVLVVVGDVSFPLAILAGWVGK